MPPQFLKIPNAPIKNGFNFLQRMASQFPEPQTTWFPFSQPLKNQTGNAQSLNQALAAIGWVYEGKGRQTLAMIQSLKPCLPDSSA